MTQHWHPVQALVPWRMEQGVVIEWLLSHATLSVEHERIALIRQFDYDNETWFRAVTWARRSEDRELLGWFRDLRTAAAYAWEDDLIRSRELHAMKPGTYTGKDPPHSPPPGFTRHP